MSERITVIEADQRLDEVLELVEAGSEVRVTRAGRTVARILPVAPERPSLTSEQRAAWERLQKTRWHLGGEKPDRDELHDRRH